MQMTGHQLIISDSINDLNSHSIILETKGLRANMKKTKVMCCDRDMHVLKNTNSIRCSSCSHWIHKACRRLKEKLAQDTTYRCNRRKA